MKRFFFMMTVTALAMISSTAAVGDIVIYRTGTNDAMELDFDGAGTQTDGDLGLTSKTFVLTAGNGLPDSGTYPDFADITSITIEFTSFDGNFSARNTAGTVSGGLGVTDGSDANPRALDQDTLETILVNISSTSTDPFQEVKLSGMRFSNWRNSFPVSQVEFSGATVNGNPYHVGGAGGTPIADFDALTNSVSFKNVSTHAGGGGWPLRLHDIRFTVTTVPEPGCAAVTLLAVLGLTVFRRRRRNLC